MRQNLIDTRTLLLTSQMAAGWSKTNTLDACFPDNVIDVVKKRPTLRSQMISSVIAESFLRSPASLWDRIMPA
jgi:hypothetical protein